MAGWLVQQQGRRRGIQQTGVTVQCDHLLLDAVLRLFHYPAIDPHPAPGDVLLSLAARARYQRSHAFGQAFAVVRHDRLASMRATWASSERLATGHMRGGTSS